MIEVHGLTRYYGSHPAVRDVSFNIDDGVIVGFLGLNGAGKSTVLKVLGGLLPPSAGNIKVGGVDVMEAPDSLRQRIGFLPEEPPLYREMRVRDFLKWCGELKGLKTDGLDERVTEVMKECHLTDVADRLIDTLSHGYRKRVGIAQAIIHRPELVILDEPISGLDPVQIVEMREVLRNLKGSCTILVSSHILSEISQTCDRILVLHRGRIVAEGSERELSAALEAKAAVKLAVRAEKETLQSLLNSCDFVEDFSLERATEAGVTNGTVRLDGDRREELVKAIVNGGLGLRRLEDAESELENVFLGLTREGATSGAVRDGADGTLGASSSRQSTGVEPTKTAAEEEE
jgi:ABC-2 type transport system ATP-binding protein